MAFRLKREKAPVLNHYIGKGEFEGHRFHLREDANAEGVLVIDASKLIYLNGTALVFTRLILEGLPEERVVRKIRSRFRKAKKENVKEDYREFKRNLAGLVKDDEKVTARIGVEPVTTEKLALNAPYRMDLALTYKCQNTCGHCYNEPKRDVKELSKEKWTEVIDRLWKIGVPHVVFTGGEPTMRTDLPDLIAHAEDNGQITGLITNGIKLADPGYMKRLADAGLDHVQITLESLKPATHDEIVGKEGAWKETVSGIKNALGSDLYVVTNTTVFEKNISEISDTMIFLKELGVKNVAFNGLIRSGSGKEAKGVTFDELTPLLSELREIADKEGMNLVWYTPTPYCELNPVTLDLGIKQCTACSINMAVEPNGDVLPCQSYYEPLGNLLEDPWKEIWEKPLCKEIRNRAFAPEKCRSCGLLDVCGGACPLSWKVGDYMCLDRHSSG